MEDFTREYKIIPMKTMLTVDVLLSDSGISDRDLYRILYPIVKGNVEIVVVDPGYMRVLNRKYRHIDRTTDVITFDLSSGTNVSSGKRTADGVIYVDGRVFPPFSELLERIFHGYLHLLGKAHDTENQEARMKKSVSRLIEKALKQ